MADAISGVTTNTPSSFDPTQISGLTNSQITALLMNQSINPSFATLLLNQISVNNVDTILFGDNSGASGNDGIDLTGEIPSNLLGTSSLNLQDSLSAGNASSITPQYEISVYSSLVGKTVVVLNPLSGAQEQGKVTSVDVKNGQAVLNLSGKLYPVANLISVKA